MGKRLLISGSIVLVLLIKTQISYGLQGSWEYTISMPKPHTHYFDIEILIKDYTRESIDLKMPVWTPGSYLIREYPKNVEGFEAIDVSNGSKLQSKKTNKNTWNVGCRNVSQLLVRYSVYAFEGSVRMSYLDDKHAFIMANTLLMYNDEFKDRSSRLRIEMPKQWNRITTSLSLLDSTTNTYYVPDYDILVDSPIEIGNHEIITFNAAGVPHEIAMYGEAEYDRKKLVRDLTKIIEHSTAIFGENPNEKYVFIVHNTGRRQGGLEHMSSTVLGVNRTIYNNDRSYNSFLSLAAHEYIHLWLVKRLKPAALEEINYDVEMYTDLLWVMEGITSYFEEKVMLRCGFFDKHQFLSNLLSTMTRIQNTPGAEVQSLTEASFDAWIKYYRRNENSDNNQISYYSKGMLVGALLDLEIINSTEGEKSLDDVISNLYYQFYKKKGRGITNSDFQKMAEDISGKSLDDFFTAYVYGTAPLDNERFLHFAGIGLVEINKEMSSRAIGITLEQAEGNIEIATIRKGSSAYENGLSVGDEIIAIDGVRVNLNNIQTVVDQFDINERVNVLIARDGLVEEKEVEIRRNDDVAYTYEMLDNKTRQQQTVYNKWLGN